MGRLGKCEPAGGKELSLMFTRGSQSWGLWVGRLFLGFVFIYAAVIKIVSPQDFADSIAAYQILPFSIINVFAWGLPLFELSCGLLILNGRFGRTGLLGIVALLALFIAAFIIAFLRDHSINCGCFGASSWLDSNPWLSLLRDAILLGLALLLYRKEAVSKAIVLHSGTSLQHSGFDQTI
jgi:putative oxidoreductase